MLRSAPIKIINHVYEYTIQMAIKDRLLRSLFYKYFTSLDIPYSRIVLHPGQVIVKHYAIPHLLSLFSKSARSSILIPDVVQIIRSQISYYHLTIFIPILSLFNHSRSKQACYICQYPKV